MEVKSLLLEFKGEQHTRTHELRVILMAMMIVLLELMILVVVDVA